MGTDLAWRPVAKSCAARVAQLEECKVKHVKGDFEHESQRVDRGLAIAKIAMGCAATKQFLMDT